VLVGPHGRPLLVDFGLAVRGAPAGLPGGGSPFYMAPEMARAALVGEGLCLRPASEPALCPLALYRLGTILHYLLTGSPPLDENEADRKFPLEARRERIYERVARGEVVPPRLRNPRVDHTLEAICLRCLGPVPGKRYASAGALAGDLRNWLE